jgi:AraC-like DNA-binding protein
MAGAASSSRGPRPGIDVRFPMHGCTLVTVGTGRYRDAHHDRPLGPGSVVLVFPEHPHWYGADEPGWDERFLAFDGPLFRTAVTIGLLDRSRPVLDLVEVDRWAARFDHFRLRPAPTTSAARDAEAAMVLALLADMIASAEHPQQVDGSWLTRSIELLEPAAGVPTPLTAVAAAVGMPYDAWRKAFRAEVGVPPARFRLDRRLAVAADLLVSTSHAVRSIAADLGFSDQRHLVVRFQEAYGCTPAAYRRSSTSAG